MSSDPSEAVREAVETLARLGHRRFALLLNDLDRPTSRARHEAFRGALSALGLPVRDPDVYPHDDSRGIQTFSLARKGDRWAGPKVFRVRCRFPDAPGGAKLPKGLFPAFWSYGTEYLYWRTSNRIECDWFELEGANPRWLNGLSTHLHCTHVRNPHVRRADSYPRYKLMGAELTEKLVGVPAADDQAGNDPQDVASRHREEHPVLEAELQAKKEDSDFWYKQYCKCNGELDALQQVVAELKAELAEYKPAEEGGDA